jgi:hypothetical protein
MIIPAITVKEEIEKLFTKKYYSDDMFYYVGGLDNFPLNISNSTECGKYEWAIMDEDKVIGFIGYSVDPYSQGVYNFGLMSFDDKNPKIGIGIKEVIQEILDSNVHRIEWKMIAGNPVERHYDFWCKRYNGTKIKLRDVTKDKHGEFHDSYIYEIILED